MTNERCTFTCVEDQHGKGSNTWECSKCKEVFQFDEGTYRDNYWSFCPY